MRVSILQTNWPVGHVCGASQPPIAAPLGSATENPRQDASWEATEQGFSGTRSVFDRHSNVTFVSPVLSCVDRYGSFRTRIPSIACPSGQTCASVHDPSGPSADWNMSPCSQPATTPLLVFPPGASVPHRISTAFSAVLSPPVPGRGSPYGKDFARAPTARVVGGHWNAVPQN